MRVKSAVTHRRDHNQKYQYQQSRFPQNGDGDGLTLLLKRQLDVFEHSLLLPHNTAILRLVVVVVEFLVERSGIVVIVSAIAKLILPILAVLSELLLL